MKRNVFSTITTKAGDTEKSVQWYRAQISKLGSLSKNKIMSGGSLVTNIEPGTMYLFTYDPKFKGSLKYYDTFPLVLPFRKQPNGFLGLNLHYLPYLLRIKLLGHLKEIDTNKEDEKMILSWRILESSSKLNLIKPCVKHYLNQHVQSRFLKINEDDWVTASQLPIEMFEKANKQAVWTDSRKYV